jgi:transcriptional regulator with XRE-family HTH domain
MINHSKLIDRIKKIISDNQLTNSSFADKIGVPRSSISHILSGRNNPSLDLIIKILKSFPEINADFLLTGELTTPINNDKSKDSLSKNMTLFPDFDIEDPPVEEKKIDEELVKSVILVYENNKFEILKNK